MDKGQCCGCRGCEDVCPVQAIRFYRDEEGYEYPEIDGKKCIHCGRCRSVCAFQEKEPEDYGGTAFYEFQAGAEDRRKSQSGGFAFALSRAFIERGGVVYGCVLDEGFRAVHIRASDMGTVERMRGSKYVQSDMAGIYGALAKDLDGGKEVLFIGMTCQVNQVFKRFGGRRNLLLADIICHGTASPRLFQEYIQYWEGREGRLLGYCFRDKGFGWRNAHIETLVFQKRRKSSDIWASIYYSHHSMRPACYHCNKTVHHSDLTMGDCWETGGSNRCKRDHEGTSIVLVHTDSGREALRALPGRIREIDPSLHMQVPLLRPTAEPEGRGQFWEDYRRLGFEGLIRRWGYTSWRGRMRTRVKIVYKRLVKEVLKCRDRRS